MFLKLAKHGIALKLAFTVKQVIVLYAALVMESVIMISMEYNQNKKTSCYLT